MEEIEKIVSELEVENGKKATSDPMVKASIQTVEAFLKNHKVLCYGGTAINNLLPPEDQFYDYAVEVPDYDFFSQTPQEHAMLLANQLAKRGIKNVEVKPGMHLGTFKVFADFEGVADITELEPAIFKKLWEENLTKKGIHYVTPNFLRMSMYLELSRPQGDISRWTKVYSRLLLLNKHYPIQCQQEKIIHHDPVPKELKRYAKQLLNHKDVVLLGFPAAEFHLRHQWTTPLMFLATKETIDRLTKGKKVIFSEGTEILPAMTSIVEPDGSIKIKFYETMACHSFHSVGGIRVASIPTILQFFFAYLFTNADKGNVESTICVAQRLMDLASHKSKRRFEILTPKECLGEQESITDIRKNKSVMFEELSKNKSSPEFVRYFFTYNPHDTATKRKKARELLRKTRKSRFGKS